MYGYYSTIGQLKSTYTCFTVIVFKFPQKPIITCQINVNLLTEVAKIRLIM